MSSYNQHGGHKHDPNNPGDSAVLTDYLQRNEEYIKEFEKQREIERELERQKQEEEKKILNILKGISAPDGMKIYSYKKLANNINALHQPGIDAPRYQYDEIIKLLKPLSGSDKPPGLWTGGNRKSKKSNKSKKGKKSRKARKSRRKSKRRRGRR